MLGFSLGGTIAVEIMSRGKIKIEKTILDAAFCVKMGLLTGLYTKAMSWSVKRICSGKKIPDFMIEFAMGKGNARIVETFYKGTDSETVKNECRDAYRYEIKSSLSDYNGEVIFLRGENEVYPAKTFRLLKKYIPQIKEIIFDGMGHGQFMNEHPEKYAETVLNVLSKSISMC